MEPSLDNNNSEETNQALGFPGFIIWSIIIGVVSSLGALFFRSLISLFHNLFFLGKLSFYYDASLHTPSSPWGAAVIFAPVVGALGVAFLVQNFAPETKGHGVPEVMDAIYYKKGIIRPVVALIKSLASALSIGSGASIGREGPIVQIGSAFGSTLAQILKLPAWQRITMIAAGAGGGIAATFNTPVGGVLFAMELLLHEVSVRTIVPVTIATATAAYLGKLIFGPNPAFVIPAFETPYFTHTNPEVLLTYLGLGVLMGGASAAYIKSIYAFEDYFDKLVPRNYYLRHAFGMLLAGTLMYLLLHTTGHYHVEGVGYATVQDILSGAQNQWYLLLILFFLKLLATSLALGSGASGGVFSPALFLGATLGGGYGLLLHLIFPGLDISPPAFAVAGMAGLVGGSTGATVTAIVMILEMTYNYSVTIPLIITVAMSYGIRTYLSRDSIYTLKLTRRGHFIPEALHTSVHHLKRARDIMARNFTVIPAATPIVAFERITRDQGDTLWFLGEERGKITAATSRDRTLSALAERDSETTAGELLKGSFIVVDEDTTLVDIIIGMRKERSTVAIITPESGNPESMEVVGVIGKEMIVDAMADAFDIFSRHG